MAIKWSAQKTVAKTPANPREALMRARAALLAMLASVAEMDAALQAACQTGLEGGIQDARQIRRLRGLPELRQCPSIHGNRDLVVRVSARIRKGIDRVQRGVRCLDSIARIEISLLLCSA